MWMSAAGRAPYGLQFLPLYLTTAPVQTQEAENASFTGGFISTSIPGYSGSGYVSGLDAPGDKCQFTFNVTQPGQYLVKFRYDTSADRSMDFSVNGEKIDSLALGTSEQKWNTWSEMSLLLQLDGGANTFTLQCGPGISGNVNLDCFSLAVYSVPEPGTLAMLAAGGLCVLAYTRRRRAAKCG